MMQHRYRRILWFFAKVIGSLIWWDIFLSKIGLRNLSQKTRTERLRKIAVQFRALAIDMGGVMIKVGQFLSTRLDVLPHEITDELTDLQDEVRPETFEDIRTVLEAEMNAPLQNGFSAFEQQPLASASIGQVHRARLYHDESTSAEALPANEINVVVKVQRPLIQTIVDTDLAALRVVVGWIQHYPPISKRANMPALLTEFSRSLYEEIDYLNEGNNAETFAKNFADWSDVRVPHVYWSHTTRRVLTLEEIRGIKITDYEQIDAAGISRKDIANRLFQTYMKQVFEDRFFHADPHPGNLFVLPCPPDEDGAKPAVKNWQLVFVDFGMTGMVTPNQLTALREILIGVGTQDIPRLIRAYQIMGVLLPGADLDMLEKATRHVFERFWGKSTTEMVSMGQQEAMAFVEEFGDLLYELPFQIPENLLLLGRGLSILSGICSGLDPDFNVWNGVMPYAEKLIANEAGRGKRGVLLDESLDFLKTFISLPKRTEALLQRIEQGKLEVQMPELKGQITRLDRHVQRLGGAVLFASFFMGSVQLYLAHAEGLAIASGAAALISLLWILLGR